MLAPGGLSVVFQPIFEATGAKRKVFALEGLVRGPKGTPITSAASLFAWARAHGAARAVDRACVGAILDTAAGVTGVLTIFVNVSATTLATDETFAAFLRSKASGLGLRLDRIAVEIVQDSPGWETPAFFDALDALRAMKVRISLDDVGLGGSNYKTILDVHPNFFKADRYFVDGCRADPGRLAILDSIAGLARRLGGRAVAEGIEDEADLKALQGAGFELFQGHLLSPALARRALASRGFLSS